MAAGTSTLSTSFMSTAGVPSTVRSLSRLASGRSQRPSASAAVSSLSENIVQQSQVESRQLPVAERASAAERINAYLRRRHPMKTAEHVAAETGLSVGTVQTWIDRGSSPGAVGLAALVCSYGPEFTAAWLGDRAPAWLTAAGREAELARVDAEMAALAAKRAALLSS